MTPTATQASSAQELEAALTRELGPLLGGSTLTKALGYRTQSAFRQALSSGRVAVAVFEIAGRRGKFALTREVAAWLSLQRGNAREMSCSRSAVDRSQPIRSE